jgi:hypothetical protein
VYESERVPAVQDLVAKYDPARAPAPAPAPAVQEREGDGAPGVRLGDLGGPVVEDPAAPRSTTPAARGMEHQTLLDRSCVCHSAHVDSKVNAVDVLICRG